MATIRCKSVFEFQTPINDGSIVLRQLAAAIRSAIGVTKVRCTKQSIAIDFSGPSTDVLSKYHRAVVRLVYSETRLVLSSVGTTFPRTSPPSLKRKAR